MPATTNVLRNALVALTLVGVSGCAPQSETPVAVADEQEVPDVVTESDSGVLSHSVQTIDGRTIEMSEFGGSVLLIVNVASECGFTPQYEQLQQVHERFADRGFAVIGFPSNQFGGQEPGTDKEILEFCESRFGVSFPMMSKVEVKGEGAHPLYAELAGAEEPIGGEPRWNFTKFLVDRDGRVVARFEPGDRPDSDAVVAAIEGLL